MSNNVCVVSHCIYMYRLCKTYMESQIGLRLPKPMLNALDKRARERYSNRSQVIREIIAKDLKEDINAQ